MSIARTHARAHTHFKFISSEMNFHRRSSWVSRSSRPRLQHLLPSTLCACARLELKLLPHGLPGPESQAGPASSSPTHVIPTSPGAPAPPVPPSQTLLAGPKQASLASVGPALLSCGFVGNHSLLLPAAGPPLPHHGPSLSLEGRDLSPWAPGLARQSQEGTCPGSKEHPGPRNWRRAAR